jgi:hypothetical protein
MGGGGGLHLVIVPRSRQVRGLIRFGLMIDLEHVAVRIGEPAGGAMADVTIVRGLAGRAKGQVAHFRGSFESVSLRQYPLVVAAEAAQIH